ncbi:zinc finger, c2h2 type domain containing protein [Trypanosoma theileri]|uniref:Zinc finger, c2h2 type domain containing protein n=1 Tax=Trypanosoma theileri TaxID=67003 RepID=A0A1X0P1Y0_9TRYP|nr:zinc finger, c2h2 type domain containing protein [Trypanosoma theileri]ORC90944.1 zinc finger, c2h2 type domain containing protein [Trypanosoma theileri]
MSEATVSLVPVECLICAEPCDALAVFNCGHHVCYICGLHIHAAPSGGRDAAAKATAQGGCCPVCRGGADGPLIVTRSLPDGGDDVFSPDALRRLRGACVEDTYLRCLVHGRELAREVAKLYEYVCPVPACWHRGVQEPFCELEMLQQHLWIDHGVEYCSVCLQHRAVFLCEQEVYSKEALRLHMDGICPQDTLSFLGHPSCRFCGNKRFYDEDDLLNHMRQDHFSCDVCNRTEFRFTYYQNRQKLLMHFEREHKLCDHPTCASLDPMVRVFASDLELAIHKQRVHGVRSKVTLFAPDATSSSPTNNNNTNNNNNNNYNDGSTTNVAHASNANAVHITFDFVSRRETVELTPKRSVGGGGGGGGKKSGGGKRGQKNKGEKGVEISMPHNVHGLPMHFRKRGVLTPLMRVEPEKADSPVEELHPRAFGVSESVEIYNTKNKVPSDRKQLQRELDTALQEELKDLQRLNDFRDCTAEFMSGKMLATRYYNCLRGDFFPSESAFERVFPLLVATVPLPERREALIQIEKMRNSPEVQRAHRMLEEEAKKKAEEEQWKFQTNLARRLKEKGNNKKGNKGPRNVWLEKGGAGLTLQQNREPQQQQQQQQQSYTGSNNNINNRNSNNNNNNNNSGNNRPSSSLLGSGSSRGTAGQQQQQQTSLVYTTGEYFHDPEDFPSLPSSNPRRALGIPQPKRSQRPNAWLRR